MEQILGRHNKNSTYTGPPGIGSIEDPFIVHDIDTLLRVGRGDGISDLDDPVFNWTLDKHYKQINDITLPHPDISGNNWIPIGDNSNPFTGSYDGGNKKISNLKINNSGNSLQGMFAKIGSGGLVENVILEELHIEGLSEVGGIAGNNESGIIQNCSVSGYIRNTSNNAGGIAGYNGSIIQNCHTYAAISGSENTGGIAGYNGSTIQNCHTYAAISGSKNTGGVAGNNTGTVEYCHTTGNIGHTDSQYVGGIVGYNDYSDDADYYGRVLFCYATGNITGYDSVGGVAGNNLGEIQNCYYADGTINGGYQVGGIAGYSNNLIQNCYATGDVGDNSSQYSGGIAGVGDSPGKIILCFATGVIYGYDYIGGIAGENRSALINCVALSKTVEITTGDTVGRIYGLDSGSPEKNYARTDMIHGAIDPPPGDGDDITYDDLIDARAFWENESMWSPLHPNWDFHNIWDWPDPFSPGKLPILRGFPSRTQYPEVPDLPLDS